jgi:hypothetical protein
VVQVACSRTKSVTDITNRLAFGELAEKHRDQVRPTGKTFLVLVGLFLPDQFIKNTTVEL